MKPRMFSNIYQMSKLQTIIYFLKTRLLTSVKNGSLNIRDVLFSATISLHFIHYIQALDKCWTHKSLASNYKIEYALRKWMMFDKSSRGAFSALKSLRMSFGAQGIQGTRRTRQKSCQLPPWQRNFYTIGRIDAWRFASWPTSLRIDSLCFRYVFDYKFQFGGDLRLVGQFRFE